ncbi:STAS domain-containing protein [Streptomyces sp. NPDC012888]|uniref:STAS domain-containing protein n=1 Tax=Streptomyces sp. NPDC012888 TaxID=3364855 RepID=UPI0036A6187A
MPSASAEGLDLDLGGVTSFAPAARAVLTGLVVRAASEGKTVVVTAAADGVRRTAEAPPWTAGSGSASTGTERC